MNATVEAAISRTTPGDARSLGWNSSVVVDVVDACLTEHSVDLLGSPSYDGIAGPGLYHLCGVASDLQRARPVHGFIRVHYGLRRNTIRYGSIGGGTYSADTAIAVPLLKVVRLIM